MRLRPARSSSSWTRPGWSASSSGRALQSRVLAAGGKLVAIGDPEQLRPVGDLSGWASAASTVHTLPVIDQVLRQRDHGDRAAVTALARGRNGIQGRHRPLSCHRRGAAGAGGACRSGRRAGDGLLGGSGRREPDRASVFQPRRRRVERIHPGRGGLERDRQRRGRDRGHDRAGAPREDRRRRRTGLAAGREDPDRGRGPRPAHAPGAGAWAPAFRIRHRDDGRGRPDHGPGRRPGATGRDRSRRVPAP